MTPWQFAACLEGYNKHHSPRREMSDEDFDAAAAIVDAAPDKVY